MAIIIARGTILTHVEVIAKAIARSPPKGHNWVLTTASVNIKLKKSQVKRQMCPLTKFFYLSSHFKDRNLFPSLSLQVKNSKDNL